MPIRNAAKPAPLTEEELTKVRELLERRERIRWLWSSIKTWAVALTAIIGAWTVGIDTLATIAKALIGKV